MSSTFSALLFQNQSPIFCCPLFHENFLNPQVRINKMVNILSITSLVLHNQFQGYTLPYFSSLSWIFSKPLCSTMVVKKVLLRNCSFFPSSVFWRYFSQRERREGIMELKELPTLRKVLVTSFDKFHHLCNPYIFGSCFIMQ